ncbi:helix-turn-helix domain-containing protein [Tsukamurella soli]
MGSFDTTAGNTLRALREAAGLKQADLAAAMSTDDVPMRQQVIANIESGSRPLKFSEAVVAARIFGVDVNTLAGKGNSASAIDLQTAMRELNAAVVTLREAHDRRRLADARYAAAETRFLTAQSAVRRCMAQGGIKPVDRFLSWADASVEQVLGLEEP